MKTSFASREAVFEALAKQPGGNSQKSRADRVRWMLEHREWWEGLYPFHDRRAFLRLAERAIDAGMYSPTTVILDVAHSLKQHAALAYACLKYKVTP